MILVNFKTYQQSSGEKALFLANYLKEIKDEFSVQAVVCPQALDIKEVLKILPNSTWTQHLDNKNIGQSTGWFPVEVAKNLGVKGTILNHSEHKLSFDVLGETVKSCKEFGLQTLIFADSLEEAKKVAELNPDWIGYEPPELIASKETSVARAKPEVIESAVKAIPNVPILVGAGVKDRQDVEVSLRLGAKGVGVSSAVILAEDPKEVLEDLASGFKL